MSDVQNPQAAKTDDEMEMEAYRSIPTLDRQAWFWSLNLASVAMGIGAESFWIGAGTFLSLFFLSSSFSITMTKHLYLTKPKS
ncbi:hypothetical protein CJU35_05125 [Pseudomonas aeruginosa]|nr:hypothetical protein [Pseudomonas aeruginosa]PBV09240.1 hypothetical protein CJU35_05125 [Pseudomonas aeruginosa]